MLVPSGAKTSETKYAANGELFARLELTADLSVDTAHGRLILQSVHTALVAPAAAPAHTVAGGDADGELSTGAAAGASEAKSTALPEKVCL